MILSVLFVLVFTITVIIAAKIYKSDDKENIVVTLFTSFILVVCVDAICALILTICRVPVVLQSILICNSVVAAILFVFEKKRGRWQSFFFDYYDMVAVAVCGIITIIICHHIFNGLSIGYNSGDSSTHFSFAMGVIRNQKVASMFLDSFYNAMIIELLSPMLRTSHYFQGLIIADTSILFVLTVMIYLLFSIKATTKWKKIIALMVAILCSMGYPLYSYMVGGYLYLTCGLMLVTYILYHLIKYIDDTKEKGYRLFCISFGIIGLVFTYMIYVPFVFVGAVATVFFTEIQGLNPEQRIRKIKLLLVLCVGAGTMMSIVVIMYLKAHGVHVGAGSAITYFLSALKSGGYMYSRLYSDFICFIPAVLLTVWNAIKKRKNRWAFFTLTFVMETVVFFIMAYKGIVAGYYYYKLYYILWILCWLSVGAFLFDDDYNKSSRIAYAITILFICFTSFFHIEDNIYIKQGSLAHHEGFTEEAKIYAINNRYLFKSYDSWWLTDDDMQLVEFAVDENSDKPCALILEYYTDDTRRWLVSRWFGAITGNVSWEMTNMEHDEFIREIEIRNYKMLALYKDSEFVKNHAEWFENLDTLMENDTIKVVSTDGIH